MIHNSQKCVVLILLPEKYFNVSDTNIFWDSELDMEDVSGAANRDQRHKGRLLHLILPPYLFHNFNSVFQERRHSFDVEVPIHFVNFVSLDFLPNSFFVYSSHSFSFLMRFVLGQTFCQPFLPML